MGMDISGLNPKNEVGKYIRFSIFSWSPMINFVKEVVPESFNKIEYPYSNDGSGLNEEDSIKLGNILMDIYKTKPELVMGHLDSLPERWSRIEAGKITETSKFFYPERIEEFAEFLINCGGFEIW